MIPRYDVRVHPQLPKQAIFWTPSTRNSDEGNQIGDFHDSERIVTDLDEAREIVAAEQVVLAHIRASSITAEEFDDLADQIEFEIPDFPSEDAPSFILETEWYGLNGLEVGVAGLAYAFNAVGIVTGASCRSHAAPHRRWADHPVVIFAANRRQAKLLQPLVEATGCGFEIDEINRPQLLGVYGPSVTELMDLAVKVLNDAAAFKNAQST